MTVPEIVGSLHFGEDRRPLLRSIDARDWPALLKHLDASFLTLPLAVRCRDYVPGEVREYLEVVLQKHALRYERTAESFQEIRECLDSRGIRFLTLKGLAQWPYYTDDPRQRPQFDLDLYSAPQDAMKAQEAILSIGYRPLARQRDPDTDHLAPLLRPTGWRWHGDYHDPDMPLTVEIHNTLWQPAIHGFEVHGAEGFPDRGVVRDAAGILLPALDPADNLSYAAWHVTRHLIAGNLRLYHVYELAHFLHRSAADAELWSAWASRGSADERLPEAIAFRLAVDWFGCSVNLQARDCMDALPARIRRWFDLFSSSPMEAAENSNKDELFLHLCLAQPEDRLRIAARRIFPTKIPRILFHADASAKRDLITGRAWHHLKALGSVSRSALRWWF